jgi:PAS domain S-box-containing protein
MLSLPPLVSAVRARPAATAVVASASGSLAIFCAIVTGSVPEAQLLVSLTVCLVVSIAAVVVAGVRERHEQVGAAARRGEALQQAMLSSAIDAVITMDHEGRVLEFNPAAEQIFGYEREEALGEEVAALIIPPKLRGRHRAALAGKLGGSSTILGNRVELTGMRADGSEFPIEVAVTRLEGPDPPVYTGYLRAAGPRSASRARRSTTRSPACPVAVSSWTGWGGRSPRSEGTSRASRSCSWTSTGSRQ